MIRRKFRNADLDEYDGIPVADQQEQTEAEYADDIVLITSEVGEEMEIFDSSAGLLEPVFKNTNEYKYHAPVLDIDFPVTLIPSTTSGHYHLYLDTLVSHEKYMNLLDALAEAGIIEKGYSHVSQERGYTAVRAPWVKKN